MIGIPHILVVVLIVLLILSLVPGVNTRWGGGYGVSGGLGTVLIVFVILWALGYL